MCMLYARKRRICRVPAEVGLPRLAVRRFCRSGGAPGRIRTRDPLLRRRLRCVPGGVLASLYMAFNCTDSGWGWPNVAWKLSAVAPCVAPLIQLAFMSFEWTKIISITNFSGLDIAVSRVPRPLDRRPPLEGESDPRLVPVRRAA